MRKSMIFGVTVAALALAPSGTVCEAAVYEAPSGIELSIADIQLDREELHGDTLVEVPVYISNNSGFVSLKTIISLDSRLRFDDDLKLGTDTQGISGINIMDCEEIDNAVSASFEAVHRSRFTENGILGSVRVIVPEDIPDGRYDISFLTKTQEFGLKILTHNSFDAWFGSDCFSELDGGSITIGAAQPEPAREQVQPEPVQALSNDEPERSHEAEENTSEAAEAVTSAATTTAAVTTTTAKTTTTATKTAVTSTLTSAEKTTEDEMSSETTVTVSEAVTEAAHEAENTDKKTKIFLVPAVMAAAIALGTTWYIVRKRR